MTAKPTVDDVVRQLLVHPVVWPDLVEWLGRRGIDVGLMPPGEDALPTYVMTPSDALLAPAPSDQGSGT
jgi:hypothetical protein